MHYPVQPAVPSRRGVDCSGRLVFVGDVGGFIADRAGKLQALDFFDGRRQPIGVAAHDHDGRPG